MTDEERKKLCEWLRGASVGWSGSSMIEPKMARAADEIERLAIKCGALERDLEWTRERVKNLEQRLPLVGVMRG